MDISMWVFGLYNGYNNIIHIINRFWISIICIGSANIFPIHYNLRFESLISVESLNNIDVDIDTYWRINVCIYRV